MKTAEKQALIVYLEDFISEQRKERFESVLNQRSDHMRVVMENIYHGHNASAVIRSCDCFGVQHIHFIENRNSLRISDEVAMGSSQWVNIHRHNNQENNSRETLLALKNKGYRIVAATPAPGARDIAELSVKEKFALVFGTEKLGISDDVKSLADDFVQIPMYGFTESFNVSVCAALCMYELSKRIRQSLPDYGLNEAEKTEVYLHWLKCSIEHSDAIISNFLSVE